jgi:hypothetical protein
MVAASWSAAPMISRQIAREEPGAVEAVMVGPVAANPLRWEVVAQTGDGYRRWRAGR